MTASDWERVDEYLRGLLRPTDPSLDSALEKSRAAGLPSIQVSPLQGRFLYLLARIVHPRSILEVGTLGGYSTIWLARALPPGGRLVSLELDPHHAEVARSNLERARLADRVEIVVGPARENLERVVDEAPGTFDLVFLDADKANTATYFALSLRLAHAGSVIVVDNVVREGAVRNSRDRDPNVQGMRRFLELAAETSGAETTVLQTVGEKGWDGFALTYVTRPPAAPPGTTAARSSR